MIFEKVCKEKPINNRPVSLFSVVCYVLETVINSHLDACGLFTESKHGFDEGKLCFMKLMYFFPRCNGERWWGNVVNVVYMDFLTFGIQGTIYKLKI